MKKLECSKQAFSPFISQHGIMKQDSGRVLLVLMTEVMINRDSWGHLYFVVRGEILGFTKDKLLRKHLPRMFSLIRIESQGIEDDQIPS